MHVRTNRILDDTKEKKRKERSVVFSRIYSFNRCFSCMSGYVSVLRTILKHLNIVNLLTSFILL